MTLKQPVSQSVGSFVLSVQTIAAAGQRQFLEFSKRGVQVKRKKERKKEIGRRSNWYVAAFHSPLLTSNGYR